MTDDCRDCVQSNRIIERLERVEKIVDDKGDMFENRITSLERRVDVSDERFKQVFQKLDEIIDILKKHEGADKERSNRLPTFIWTVGGMVLGGVIVGVIMWFLQSVL